MKGLKRLLVVTLSVLLTLGACLSLVACDDSDEPEEKKPTVNVTVAEYDTNKGTVTLDKASYNVGDTATFTVTAKAGYEIMSVYVDSNNLTDRLRNGSNDFTSTSYTFTANQNRTITVMFQTEGTWKNSNYIYSLNVTPYNTSMGAVSIEPERGRFAQDEEVTLTVTTAAGFIIKSVTVNNIPCTLSDGEYKFNVTQNTTVTVIFDVDVSVITQATAANIDGLISRKGKVLLDFWADDCYYCTQVLAPQLNTFITNYNSGSAAEVALDIKIVKVRVGSSYSLAENTRDPELYPYYEKYLLSGKSGLPYVVLLDDGEIIGALNGAYNEYSQLLSWLQNPTK